MKRAAFLLLIFLASAGTAAAREPKASSPTVRGLHFEGNTAFKDAELAKAARLTPGKPLDEDAQVVAELVKSHYLRNGYLEAGAEAWVSSTTAFADVRVRVTQGPLYHYGKTTVTGLSKLPSRVAELNQSFKPGDPYVRSKLFDTQADLYATGLFDDVTISASTNSARTADVRIELRERALKWIKGGVGYGSEERERLSLILLHQNLFHRAFNAQLSGTWSAIWRENRLDFTNPYFWDTRTEMRTTALWRHEDRDGYKFERIRGELNFGRKLGRHLSGSAGLRWDHNVIYNLDPGIAVTTPDFPDARSMVVGLNRETANDFFFPTLGSRTRVSLERFGGFLGGLLDVNRATLETDVYRPIWGPLVGALALRTGIEKPFDGTTDVPVYERFFMGGGTTVRGYRERGVGPKSPEGDPLGGIRQLGSSVEVRFPIISRLRGAVFVDGGQVGDHWNDVTPHRWKWGAGTGIRFLTPVGPFRLDYGYKLNRDSDDRSRYRFHFSLGESF